MSTHAAQFTARFTRAADGSYAVGYLPTLDSIAAGIASAADGRHVGTVRRLSQPHQTFSSKWSATAPDGTNIGTHYRTRTEAAQALVVTAERVAQVEAIADAAEPVEYLPEATAELAGSGAYVPDADEVAAVAARYGLTEQQIVEASGAEGPVRSCDAVVAGAYCNEPTRVETPAGFRCAQHRPAQPVKPQPVEGMLSVLTRDSLLAVYSADEHDRAIVTAEMSRAAGVGATIYGPCAHPLTDRLVGPGSRRALGDCKRCAQIRQAVEVLARGGRLVGALRAAGVESEAQAIVDRDRRVLAAVEAERVRELADELADPSTPAGASLDLAVRETQARTLVDQAYDACETVASRPKGTPATVDAVDRELDTVEEHAGDVEAAELDQQARVETLRQRLEVDVLVAGRDSETAAVARRRLDSALSELGQRQRDYAAADALVSALRALRVVLREKEQHPLVTA